MSKLSVVEPKEEYDRKNEAAFREEVRTLSKSGYDKRGDLIVPIGKKLAFTSPSGIVVTLGFDGSGNFTIQQNVSTPVSMASISYVTTVETTLTTSIASLTVDVAAAYASGSQGSINSSATFADNANATGIPTNWTDWSNGSGTRVTGIAPQPYAFTLAASAAAETGIGQTIFGRTSTGWHVIEADITLVSGALTGAGCYVDWDGGGVALGFATDTDINGSVIGAGTTGKLYKFRKLVQVTAGTTASTLYAMSHWSGHGSIASANSITWHRCAIRAASQAEIEARQAKTDLVTTNANVATNTSAVATINGAAAFWETIVSASGGDLSAVRLKAGSSGAYLELISTVLRLANVTNGSVIEVMRAISGEAYFSRPISSDSASRRLTIGPGYGVSGQEVVLWFGPVATAPTSQSRTNGYFSLGTDGKIYFGAVDATLVASPLTASFSPTYVDTTHTTNVALSQNVTATASGGSGTYTYVWSVGDVYSGNTPTLTNQYSATVTVNVTHTAIATIDGVIVCTVKDTVTGKQYVGYWSYYSEGTGGGSGSGGGGGRPP